MRGRAILLVMATLSLGGCEKDFDEKYQDNLKKLNEEARAIEAGVSQQLAEGREADKIIEPTKEAEDQVGTNDQAAR